MFSCTQVFIANGSCQHQEHTDRDPVIVRVNNLYCCNRRKRAEKEERGAMYLSHISAPGYRLEGHTQEAVCHQTLLSPYLIPSRGDFKDSYTNVEQRQGDWA